MISIEEYCAAAKVVKAFHAQMKTTIEETDILQNIMVSEFLKKNPNMSKRLRDILKSRFDFYHIGEIEEDHFKRQTGVGNETWAEFVTLRDMAVNKRKAEINKKIQEMANKQSK